jgi:hypothetical protein
MPERRLKPDGAAVCGGHDTAGFCAVSVFALQFFETFGIQKWRRDDQDACFGARNLLIGESRGT